MSEISYAVEARQRLKTTLAKSDPDLWQAIEGEHRRQQDQIELIASENFVSRAVLQAQGSILTNKTVEGYPGARYYGGAEFADIVERLAVDRARQLFNCRYANVQPHSGTNANQAVFLALLQDGDTILSMNVAAGGHISHGHPATQTGRHFRIVSYGVTKDTERLDYASVHALACTHKPRLIIAGGSAYPRAIDFASLRATADAVGAYLLVDMAHFAGLVATGLHPHPFPHAHIVTTTTYKSLRGARGAIILTDDTRLAKLIAPAVFPGVQGSVLLHAVAGKAACLHEAMQPEFLTYNRRVLANARVLSDTLSHNGIRLVSGGTDTGLMLVDLRPLSLTGSAAVEALERAGLTCNKNVIPGDPQPAEIASGLRLSTNAGTARGFGEAEFHQIGTWIATTLKDLADCSLARQPEAGKTREAVRALCEAFPVRLD